MTRGPAWSFRKKFTSMLSDPSGAFGAMSSAPSEIKQLDLLIEHLEDGTETSYLHPLFEELDCVLGSLYAIYLNELQFLADGEPQNAAANQIASEFGSLRPLLADLRNELSLGEFQTSLESARELKVAVARLFTSFGDMKAQAQRGTRYSELPFTQELLRVAHHYLAGNLPQTAVQERLDAFCNYHDNLELSLEQMVPTEAEQPILAARREELEEALALQLQGIEDLDVALERRSDQGVKNAIETLRIAAETLYEIYEDLTRAEMGEPATVSCFRCGASSSAESRLCSGCGAVLPRFDAGAGGDKPSSRIEIRENAASEAKRPNELLRLEQAVEEALASHDNAPLWRALEAFETRLRTVERQIAAWKEAPSDVPHEHLQLLQEGRGRLREATTLLLAGHALLREGASHLDGALLRRGLQEVESGYETLQSFNDTFERAEKLTR